MTVRRSYPAALLASAILLFVLPAAARAQQRFTPEEIARWEQQAQAITIVRDDWGIPHVRGRTDADAVFGVMYAQAEDDFNRVETNYLNALGRLAEAEGESAIWSDLRMRLFIHEDSLKAQFARSPEWLRKLMVAFADGLNYYLYTHPEVKPRALTRFEPWMALSFTEGSIGGDIERVNINQLRAFYDNPRATLGALGAAGAGADAAVTSAAAAHFMAVEAEPEQWREPSGSNGIAIAPANTVNGHALLLINPHTSFYFRAEAQMTSEEGLNAYGAITWGQFFIYQGFNERAGWMHTSSSVDNIDEYLETIVRRPDGLYYRYGEGERKVVTVEVDVAYRTAAGLATRRFTTWHTHHGPIVRAVDGRWVSVRLMQDPIDALTQSYSRTKATDYRSFREIMSLHTNSSNNTIFADASGNIAYLHANFVPRRDTRFDWNLPVDGSDPATEWGAPFTVEESPFVLNPSTGWLYNTNNWPYSAAGRDSPRREDYPAYMDAGRENARGIHAIRVLEGRKDFTLESLIGAAYDSYLPAFEPLIPALVQAWDALPGSDPQKAALAPQVRILRDWDLRWAAESVPTSLAVFWAEELGRRVGRAAAVAGVPVDEYLGTRTTPAERLAALAAASDTLIARFGSWRTPWGEINRFQRITSEITPRFDDDAPSTPVPFTSARWGSLASFGARSYGTRRIYGNSGNSFVAVVEFGERVRARAVMAGGQSGDPASPHFRDQVDRYAAGQLREVYFYPEQLQGHTERTYRPGERSR